MEPEDSVPEIEITPEMVAAGVEVLWRSQESASSSELVEAVYRAMVASKNRILDSASDTSETSQDRR